MPVRKEVQREVKTNYRTGERRSMPGGKGEEKVAYNSVGGREETAACRWRQKRRGRNAEWLREGNDGIAGAETMTFLQVMLEGDETAFPVWYR